MKEKDPYLIVGASGLIGRAMSQSLSKRGIRWKGTYHSRFEPGLVKWDITNLDETKNIFSKFNPISVVLCTNLPGGVDFCDENRHIAAEFHLNSTKRIGQYCKEVNATLIYLSTDYVFDGGKYPYQEEAMPNPLNVYGQLKFQSEQWIQENLKKFLIIRTTNVYGWDPQTVTPNYMMNLYRALQKGKIFHAPSFLFGNPTYVVDLVQGILELCEKNYSGLFHIVGDSFINRFQWALDAATILGLEMSLIKELKYPISNKIERPLKSWLSNKKFKDHCKTKMHNHLEGLNLMKLSLERSY
ncbi:MAG: SDR family oxidoreductase [Deltaproteobacteria bacterium]|nr:SDR family oxidoreductase [Deltaproteobacteria bacterium]